VGWLELAWSHIDPPSASAMSLIISGSITFDSWGKFRQALLSAIKTRSAHGWG